MKLPTKVKITVQDLPKTEYDDILKEEQKPAILQFLEGLVCTQEKEIEFCVRRLTPLEAENYKKSTNVFLPSRCQVPHSLSCNSLSCNNQRNRPQ